MQIAVAIKMKEPTDIINFILLKRVDCFVDVSSVFHLLLHNSNIAVIN